jgi:hypothetical protein
VSFYPAGRSAVNYTFFKKHGTVFPGGNDETVWNYNGMCDDGGGGDVGGL